MPRTSKSIKAKVNNLSKAWESNRKPSRASATIVGDNLRPSLDLGDSVGTIGERFRALEEEGIISEWEESEGSESKDSAMDLGEEGEAEIRDDAALFAFVQKLQDVQKVAEERAKIFKNRRKRPHMYTKNSTRTKEHNAAKRRKLAADPSVWFITNFFTKKETASFKEKLPNALIYVSSTDEDEIEVIEASPAALVHTCSCYHEIT